MESPRVAEEKPLLEGRVCDYFGFKTRDHREAFHLILYGGFDGVRYGLHRLFVQQHVWTVDGLPIAGDAEALKYVSFLVQVLKRA